MKTIRDHINLKLLLSYLAVLVVGAAALLLAVLYTAPVAYNRHMQMSEAYVLINGTPVPFSDMMGIGPGHGPGMGVGPGQGDGPGFLNFRAGLLESLGYAVFAAVIVAVVVSVIFSRGIVAPIRAMKSASQRIAAGRYDERVVVSGSDELAQLAGSFNQMAERLEQTESMRRQLIGDVSHELRTPLTAIGGYMEGLTDGVLPATPETFEQVRMEASRLSRLVDDLQELSRVEAGAYKLETREVKLYDLMNSTVKRFAHPFAEKHVRLVVFSEGGDDGNRINAATVVTVDEDRIAQVLTNLLANALAYTPAGGEVAVSARMAGEQIEIAVKDSGAGIPAESLAHIFDRFYRVDKSRSRAAGGGSGIGLTIAKALVEAHGGSIRAESEEKGRVQTLCSACRRGKRP